MVLVMPGDSYSTCVCGECTGCMKTLVSLSSLQEKANVSVCGLTVLVRAQRTVSNSALHLCQALLR